MTQPFLGEIRMFAGNFAPVGWARCDGQLLSISQNSALFSLFGALYGGDAITTFGLPDLRGRLPIHMGQGPGLTSRPIGSSSGSETVTLNVSELPAHNHALNADGNTAGDTNPIGNTTATSTGASLYSETDPPGAVGMNADAIQDRGGGQAHDNIMPFLCVNFIVALFGLFPSED